MARLAYLIRRILAAISQATDMMGATAPLFLLFLNAPAARSEIVISHLNAILNTGSLAGTKFTVSFSYDSSQVSPSGDSYVQLIAFDFTLLRIPFTRYDIFQGGQAIFRDGVINDVTASFQVILPPNSPVLNITFGFGGPGVIAYIDLSGQYGDGSFTIGDVIVHQGTVFAVLIHRIFSTASLGWRSRSSVMTSSRCATNFLCYA